MRIKNKEKEIPRNEVTKNNKRIKGKNVPVGREAEPESVVMEK